MIDALRFGVFTLDPTTGELLKAGVPVHLPPQPFKVLAHLASRPGQLVSREELRQEVWGDRTFVDFEQGLNSCVRQIRTALGDDAESPRYVETVPRRGYRFLADVKPVAAAQEPAHAQEAGRERSRPRRRAAIALGLAAAGLAALAYATRSPSVSQAPRRPRIAVLPFENLSGDPAQEYMSDGVTEEMIAALGQLEIGVIARTSAMRYKATRKPVDQIGRELHVDYVLEGSVRQSLGRLRITAQLVQTSDQVRLWGDVYERDARDVLAVQSDVAKAVAQEIRLQLTEEQRERLVRLLRVDPEAYADYLRGRQAWSRRSASGLREALARFEAAIARDPTYAPAHAGLADTLSLMSLYSGVPPQDSFPKARAAARRALDLDPRLAEAHTSVAYVAHRFDWDWGTAEAHYRRALALNPSYATARHWRAELLLVLGRLAEARLEMQRAYELDPLSPRINLDLGLPDYFEGRYDAAIDRGRKALAMEPGFLAAHAALRAAHEMQGSYEAAIGQAREIERLGGSEGGAAALGEAWRRGGAPAYWAARLARAEHGAPPDESPAHVANLHAMAGHDGPALDWLEKAYAGRDDELVWIAVEPACVQLRDDPRFASLLRRMGLAQVRAPGAR